MPQPLTVEVPHQFTKEEAKSRIQDGMSQVRAQLSAFVTSIEDRWTEDQMDFRLIAVGQTVTVPVTVGSAPVPFFCKYHRTSGMVGSLIPQG